MGTAEFFRRTTPGVFGPGLIPLSTFEGPAENALAASRPFPTMPAFGAGFSLNTGQPFGKEGTPKDDRNDEKIAAAIGREIGPLISAFSGGGIHGAVAGAGGIASTLASLNNPNTGKALLGTAAPWLSLAGGVLSGVSSLLGGSKPKVIITAFEEEAARQIKELRSDPATTSYIIIGPADMRQTQQQLARLGRMGVISRLPR
jgi:hypothetical protein